MDFSFWRSHGDEARIAVPAIGLRRLLRKPRHHCWARRQRRGWASSRAAQWSWWVGAGPM